MIEQAKTYNSNFGNIGIIQVNHYSVKLLELQFELKSN